MWVDHARVVRLPQPARRTVLLAISCGLACAPASNRPVAFTHATVIDVVNGTRLAEHTVVIQGDRIERIGPSDEVTVPRRARVVDARGQFIIPGLLDMHVHPDDPEIWERFEPEPHLRDLFMPNFIAWGVTGVRDMGGSWPVIRDWNVRIAAGELVGPRIVAAGPLLDGPDPSWPGSVAITDETQGRAAVDSLVSEGVEFIKVYDGVPRDAFFAIVDQAHRRGMRVSGHVPLAVSLDDAVRAHLDDQQHLLKLERAFSDWGAIVRDIRARASTVPRERLGLLAATAAEANYDAAAARQYYRRLAADSIWVTPTLVVWRRNAWYSATDSTVAPYLQYVPSYLREWWTPEVNVHLRDRTDASIETLRTYFRIWRRIAGEVAEEGVGVLAGSDTGGNPHLIPGLSLHEELALLVDAGLAPIEALRAATINPAVYMRLDSAIGSVEAGKVADLVILDADPLADIRNTRRIAGIVYRGTYLDAAGRGALLESIATRAGPF